MEIAKCYGCGKTPSLRLNGKWIGSVEVFCRNPACKNDFVALHVDNHDALDFWNEEMAKHRKGRRKVVKKRGRK